jgi:hypothetical protein
LSRLSADERLSSGQPLFWLVRYSGSEAELGEFARRGYRGPVEAGKTLTVWPADSNDERQGLRRLMVNVASWIGERTGVEDTVPGSNGSSDGLSWRRLGTDRQVLLVPVVKPSGGNQVVVDGFAAIEVTDIDRNGIQIQPVNVVAPQAEVAPTVRVAQSGAGGDHHYGLYGVRLVEWRAPKSTN